MTAAAKPDINVKYTVKARKNVPDVRLRPTRPSFGPTGKNSELITGMSNRTVASDKRIFATNSSPATPASARTGSGRDHSDSKKFVNLGFIVSCTPGPGLPSFSTSINFDWDGNRDSGSVGRSK